MLSSDLQNVDIERGDGELADVEKMEKLAIKL